MVPARTPMNCGRASDCTVTGVPHFGQSGDAPYCRYPLGW